MIFQRTKIIILIIACASISYATAATKSSGKNPSKSVSVLFIDNENNKEMDILIKPELIDDRTVDDTKRIVDPRTGEWVTARIPANSTIRLELPQHEIGEEVDFFSVTGETNRLTPIGCCYNLKIGRNYFLRFTDNSFGTDCILAEMAGKVPGPSDKRIKIPYARSKPHLATDTEFAPNRPSQDEVSLSGTPTK